MRPPAFRFSIPTPPSIDMKVIHDLKATIKTWVMETTVEGTARGRFPSSTMELEV